MNSKDEARNNLVIAIARTNRRALRRPVVVNWQRQPFVSIGWPLFVIHIHLN
jgi:arsenate reductase-like glutaredoxin family protein